MVRLELPRDQRALAEARRAVDQLRPTLDPQTIDDARLLISQLVTNSVVHGAGDSVTLIVDSDVSGKLRCEVIDQGTGFVPRGRQERVIGGWGLSLVDQLATSWGVREGSTHVWFELPTHPRTEP
jgi:anti-sigma regulatory factor (Ser/Thr protein kinase)